MATRRTYGRSMTDASDALYDFSCTPCSGDGKNAEGLYQCVDCQMFYCQRCVESHNKFTNNHNLLDKSSAKFGQAQIQKVTPSSSELPTDVCEDHNGEVVKMFCGQHDEVCCTVCIAVKHRSCVGVEYIPNIAKKLLQGHGKEKTKSSLEKVKDDLQNLKSKMQDELKSLNQERDDIIDAIQQFKRSVLARIDELEKQSLKDVQTKHKAISREIDACSRKIDHMLKYVELRLDKLRQPKTVNEAQTFVDIKYAEQTSSLGKECAKTSTQRNVEHMGYEINTGLKTYLSGMESLGTLNDWQARVNIIPYFEGWDSDLVNKFTSLLQEKLRKSFMIESNCIRPEEIVADRYTILVFERSSEDMAVKNILRKYDDVVILLDLYPHDMVCVDTGPDRDFKASFSVVYGEYGCSDICDSFQDNQENQQTYERLANFIKSAERVR